MWRGDRRAPVDRDQPAATLTDRHGSHGVTPRHRVARLGAQRDRAAYGGVRGGTVQPERLSRPGLEGACRLWRGDGYRGIPTKALVGPRLDGPRRFAAMMVFWPRLFG
jgi:hypothetical protein